MFCGNSPILGRLTLVHYRYTDIKIILIPPDAHERIGTNCQQNQDQDKTTVTWPLISLSAKPHRTTTNQPNRSLHHGLLCQIKQTTNTMVHTRSHANVQKEKYNNKKQLTKAAPVLPLPTPPPLSPWHSNRGQGASPDGPPNELLNTVMKDLVTKDGIWCSAFGRYRQERYRKFYFCANCDDWDAAFYSAPAGQIARWGQCFSCLACHDPDSLFPTHRLKMPPKK